MHHGVNGVFELQDLAAHIHRYLLGQVTAGDGGRDVGDVTHLARQIAGHGVHAVGQVLPGAGHASHVGLPAQPAFGADFAGHARDLRRERIELIHHRVDGVFQLRNLATHIHGHFLGQVTAGDGSRDVGDVAHLPRQIPGHGVDAIGEVLPDTGYASDLGLAAELPFRAHFQSHARDLGSE